MKIDIIAGARPNFMKIAPIIFEISLNHNKNLNYRLIHTGQHYDKSMSDSFFNQLQIPNPDINLGVGSGTHAEQTARIMIEYEKVLLNNPKPDICLVVGDVNSTLACSIVAKKMKIKVAHVEAGIRSCDLNMPEEINRIVTDSITDYFFTTSKKANDNLKKLGVQDKQIIFVGNTMIDTLLKNINKFKKPSFYEKLNLETKKYFVLTLHRPSNVDQNSKLLNTVKIINNNVNNLPVIFPAHPRTLNILSKSKFNFDNIKIVNPQPYFEFNYLVKNSLCVITDSGGITEETTVMGVPCMTLRDNTERPETVEIGTNELVGSDPKNLIPFFKTLFKNKWKKGTIPKFWDGNASKRIVDFLKILKN